MRSKLNKKLLTAVVTTNKPNDKVTKGYVSILQRFTMSY